jgi:hypothetical protein
MNPRVASARTLIDERIKGNSAVGSNHALLRAIGTLAAAGETVPNEVIQIARKLTADPAANEECEWCGISVEECQRMQTSEEDEEGCPGPELRALCAQNVQLRTMLIDAGVPFIPPPASTSTTPAKNPISELHELAMKWGSPNPTFTFMQRGPAHTPTIHCEAHFGTFRGEAVSRNKQEAKRLAAIEVLNAIHKAHK